MTASDEQLRPARFEEADSKAFAPRVRWTWAVGVVAVLLAFVVGYRIREQVRVSELRGVLQQTYAQKVAQPGRQVIEFQNQIDRWVRAAAAQEPNHWVAEGFQFSDLHDRTGLYLRLPISRANRPEQIQQAARSLKPDAIGRCLGLAPLSARGLYARGDFLSSRWRRRIPETDSVLRLRVVEEELTRHIERDLPVLRRLIESEYFFLVLEQGNRRTRPVDAFVWDLKSKQPLFRGRVQASGGLVSARLRFGAHQAKRPNIGPESFGAVDCSIASKLKQAAP